MLNLTHTNQKQLSFFTESNPKQDPIMQIVDRLNKASGNNKIKLGFQFLDHQWKMKQERLSPRYTTNIQKNQS